MARIYFEEKGEALLKNLGITKAEFARRMGIREQNVKALFKTRNLDTIKKAAEVLNVPFEMLIGYTAEPDIPNVPYCIKEYSSFEGMPREAFWFLIDREEGRLGSVFTRSGIGTIDLVWGDESYGVCRILLRQIYNKDFSSVDQMIRCISDIIMHGRISCESEDELVLKKSGYQVVLIKNYRLGGKKPESDKWILASYSK